MVNFEMMELVVCAACLVIDLLLIGKLVCVHRWDSLIKVELRRLRDI